MSRFSCILILTFVMLCLLDVRYVIAAELTEADFRSMKIKDLRAFLSDRGLTCAGCQEKSDFIRVAMQNRNKKPSAGSEVRRPPPNKKLWEAWGENAKNICVEEVTKRGNDATTAPFSSVCETVFNAVDSFFMQHGKRIANRLKKTPDHMLKTSYKDVYYDAGIVYFKRLVNQCLVSPSAMEKCESLGQVMSMMEKSSTDFNTWLTNVGIENTNPMYEILQSRHDGDL